MPIEYNYLRSQPPSIEHCPKCGAVPFHPMMRGLVQRSKRFLGFLWRRDYCAVICSSCKEIVGYESP